MQVFHVNCGFLHAPPNPRAGCHCLLLEDQGRLALVDTGIGLLDAADPEGRIGPDVIALAGFQFHESETAVRQVERLGFSPAEVTDIVLTHADPDHTGGLGDFPQARVHVSAEEHAQVLAGHWRCLPSHFAHSPDWQVYPPGGEPWFGLESRRVHLGSGDDVRLIPLFGHTLGHCGVAVRLGDGWLLHVGDAYYLRAELTDPGHPVHATTAKFADDNDQRLTSLAHIKRLLADHPDAVELFGYHDLTEFPPELAYHPTTVTG